MAIIHEFLLPAALVFDMEISVSYQATKLRNALTYKFPFKTMCLSSNKQVYIERSAVTREFLLTTEEGRFFNHVFCHNEKLMRKDTFKERIDIAGMKLKGWSFSTLRSWSMDCIPIIKTGDCFTPDSFAGRSAECPHV